MTICELIEATENEMERVCLSAYYIKKIREIWLQFERYSLSQGEEQFNRQLVCEFAKSNGKPFYVNTTEAASPNTVKIKECALRKLIWMAELGYITRCSNNKSCPLPLSFQEALTAYRSLLEKRNLSSSTKKAYMDRIGRFTHYLSTQGVIGYADMSKIHINGYLKKFTQYAKTTAAEEYLVLRAFLRFLHENGTHPEDLSREVPKLRIPLTPMESRVWTAEELHRLLSVVDRGSPRGKRDYAILLLAARLGMRDSDIRNLRLDNVRWEDCAIEYLQSKTGVSNVLPMAEEIGVAIIDYLKYGRPQTSCPNLFVSCVPPYGAVRTAGHYIDQYRKLAGIPKDDGKHNGLHSLRHTLATRLLSAHVPVDQIVPILGHTNHKSVNKYFQTDIENLRKCALPYNGIGE